MIFKDLLDKYDANLIFDRIGVSLAVNDSDYKKQKQSFLKAYKLLKETPEASNNLLIYGLSGYFYEQPAGISLEGFLLNKDIIKEYKQLPDLEKFMFAKDSTRNNKIARLESQKIKELMTNNKLPEFEDIQLSSWNDIINAEILEDNLKLVNEFDFVCCIIDLMMSFDTNEKKSHQLVIKNRKENELNPLTMGSRRKTSFARHLYHYKILQTLAHKEG